MRTGVILVTVLIFIGGAGANYLRYVEPVPDRGPDLDGIPMQAEGYTGSEHFFSEQSYEVLQADTSTLRNYVDAEGHSTWLFLGYFESQKYGSQIHSPKHCLPGGGWKIASIEPFDLELNDGTRRNVNRLIVTERGRRHLMFYWFETRGGIIRNEFALKWDLMVTSLLLRPTDAAIIRVSMPLTADDTIESGTIRALDFFNKLLPSIERSLPFGD